MNQEEKPHAPSCDRNKEALFETLKPLLSDKKNLIEIGSGTGQHALFIASKMPHLTWTLSDLEERHRGMSLWLREEPILNVKGPLIYEAGLNAFPESIFPFDVAFTANTLHIMNWNSCTELFDDLGTHLKAGALFIAYGAFKYNGEFSSESNKDFEVWLKEKNKNYCQKNFEDICNELSKNSFKLIDDIQMPANNQLLVFKKA